MNGSAVALLAFLFLLNLTQVARLVGNKQKTEKVRLPNPELQKVI